MPSKNACVLVIALGLAAVACSGQSTIAPAEAGPVAAPTESEPADESADEPDAASNRDAAAAHDATTADAGAAADAAPATCSTLSFGAPAVTINESLGAARPPTGGAITPGAYDLTRFTIYTTTSEGPTTKHARVSMRFSSTAIEIAELNSAGKTELDSGSFTASATTLMVTYTCPGPPGAKTFTYSASPTEIRFLYSGASVTELVFTRRPGT